MKHSLALSEELALEEALGLSFKTYYVRMNIAPNSQIRNDIMLILLTDKDKVLPVHTEKAYEEAETMFQSFLTSAVHEGSVKLHARVALSPGCNPVCM
jgi:hypothetical protein